ncbi:hypothetical protein VOM14_05830 [Paraburkholderia sp. MPAMCS5]|uniref:hypothetical protein n=1 Tax=Paraburkholderia sp. MPAMCS5 TaxID=3112563 RepID=UPI002E176F10|nr:hypothetical protein [Paraburkholderia sp. MPAMCS5]
MKRFALLALPPLLAACATPAGQLTDADFKWEQATVSATPAQVFRGVMERARRCGSFGKGIPDGQFYPDISEQTIDLYLVGAMFQARNDHVLGRVVIAAAGDGATRVRAGVQPYYTRSVTGADLVRLATDPASPCS